METDRLGRSTAPASVARYSVGAAELAGFVPTFLRELRVDEYPNFAEHVEQHLRERSADDKGAFEFGLDLILDGLERFRDTA